MFLIHLRKGKRIKRIICSGRLLTETTLFPDNLSCELQYKLLKDKVKSKGWNTYIPPVPAVCSKIEHTKSERKDTIKILGRVFDGNERLKI